jgi:sulfoxide reductase heme-binding subunit YedZ
MDEALWALGRGTGVVSLVLLTVTVLLGILTRSGRPALGLPRFAVTLIHRNASLLASLFIVVHLVSLFFDPYAQLTLVDFVVPFLGDYQPVWLGLGTLAVDILVVVMITGLLRARIGQRTFRVIHWFTYAMWPLALAHALGTGTDAWSPWFLAIAATCTLAVVVALGWRASRQFVEYRMTRQGELA